MAQAQTPQLRLCPPILQHVGIAGPLKFETRGQRQSQACRCALCHAGAAEGAKGGSGRDSAARRMARRSALAHHCALCGSDTGEWNGRLKKCSACHRVMYCSRRCPSRMGRCAPAVPPALRRVQLGRPPVWLSSPRAVLCLGSSERLLLLWRSCGGCLWPEGAHTVCMRQGCEAGAAHGAQVPAGALVPAQKAMQAGAGCALRQFQALTPSRLLFSTFKSMLCEVMLLSWVLL